MANQCITSYAITGDNESLVDFYEKLQLYKDNVKSGFGISEDLSFRGTIFNIELEEGVLRVDTETAWVPTPEIFDAIIEKHYPGKLSHVFVAEEPGFELYVNTDIEGKNFPERYYVEIYKEPGYTKREYPEDYLFECFDNDEDLLEGLNKFLGRSYKSLETALLNCDKFNKKHNGDRYVTVHAFDTEY